MEGLVENLVDKELIRTLSFTRADLNGMTLDQKIKLISPEAMDKIFSVVFANPEKIPELPKNIWIVIAAKLDNQSLVKFSAVNRHFHSLLNDLTTINAILLRRWGPDVFNQLAFEERLPLKYYQYNNPILRLRAFEMTAEIWYPTRKIPVPNSREMVLPAAVHANIIFQSSKPPLREVHMITESHIISKPDEAVPCDLYLNYRYGSDIHVSENERFLYITLQSGRKYARIGDGYIKGLMMTRADFEQTFYMFMTEGYNTLTRFELSYMARVTDHIESAKKNLLLLAPICGSCNRTNPQFMCGNCGSAYYCNQNCADAHYAIHKCK